MVAAYELTQPWCSGSSTRATWIDIAPVCASVSLKSTPSTQERVSYASST